MSAEAGHAGGHGRFDVDRAVTEVGLRSSKVQLLNDLSSAVNVRLQTSNVTGLATGQQDGSLLVQYLPLDAKIADNDIALTSGLGGNLPRNLVVGQVTGVQKKHFDVSQAALFRPAADYERLDVVLVINNFEVIGPVEGTPTPEAAPWGRPALHPRRARTAAWEYTSPM